MNKQLKSWAISPAPPLSGQTAGGKRATMRMAKRTAQDLSRLVIGGLRALFNKSGNSISHQYSDSLVHLLWLCNKAIVHCQTIIYRETHEETPL